jgi:uncharacterized 2Fe-2S/4Fe-4S cluster protein (DUF4445 family)
MLEINSKHTIIFQPSGKRSQVAHDTNIKQASVLLAVDIEGNCGEQGTCGKCKVRIAEGRFEKYGITSDQKHLSPVGRTERDFITPDEEKQGFRLACQAGILDDIVVFVPEESRLSNQLVRKEARNIPFVLNPAVKHYNLDMSASSIEDHLGDWERLQKELKNRYELDGLTIDYQVLLNLQTEIRKNNRRVAVDIWKNQEVIRVSEANNKHIFGIAIDIGTTTLAGYLCDLVTGELVTTVSMMNPQVIFGEDVMSRITYTMVNPNGLTILNKTILDGLNDLSSDACLAIGIDRQDILDMTIVGNTCMHHLFLGIDPRYIGKAPFVPALQSSVDIKARDIGYVHNAKQPSSGINVAPGAYVHVLPIEAGFVGADNVAVLITEKPYEQDNIELIIDIGTNGELIMGNRQRLVSCSCATGPALEGAEIRHGMRASPGAIEKIVIDKAIGEVQFKVIGKDEWNTENKDIKARGICGSAIIDIAPQLLQAGIIDKTGLFNRSLNLPRLKITGDSVEYVIAWSNETAINRDITVCQQDIRAIQLAKAAMYAGAKIMMRRLGITKIDKVILAGAFGNYIDKESAAYLGLFPDCDIANIVAVGNAAGDGARLALLDINKRIEADLMSRKIEYIELTCEPDFDRLFAQAMWIPHMKDEFPHLKRSTH